MILSYKIHTVTPYINWIYFFHAWGFQPRIAAIANIHGCDACRASWLTTFPEEERSKASEAMQLFKEANRMLDLLDRDYEVKTLFKLCKANADGDNLIIEKEKDQFVTFPLLRQQTPKRDGSPFLCLSDFIRPLSSGIPDTIGAFASSIDADMEGLYEQDPQPFQLACPSWLDHGKLLREAPYHDDASIDPHHLREFLLPLDHGVGDCEVRNKLIWQHPGDPRYQKHHILH